MGGFRVRFYGEVIFSARNVGRAWLAAVVFAVARLALVRRAPLEPGPRFLRVRARYRRWAEARRANPVAFYALLAVVTFWLALGSEYWLYWYIYDLPGFNFIRVSTRYTLLTLLALAVLAAAGFDYLAVRLRPAAKWWLAAFCAAVLVADACRSHIRRPVPARSAAVDRWLDTLPKPFAIAELPLDAGPNLAAQELRQSRFMLHSTAHWQKTVHGYGGIRPKLHFEIFSAMAQFPDDESLLALTSVGVGYVVIHTDYYPAGEWARVEARLPDFSNWLTLEKTIDAGRVYSLRRPPQDELLRGRFKAFVHALDARDSQALSGFYTSDARMVRPNGHILSGGAAIAEWMTANPEAAASLTLTPRSFDTDTGTVRGRFTLGRGPSAPRGEFLQVWKPVFERWMLADDLFSVDGAGR
jgi:ketosteroid isomerase-like protein